MLKDQFRSEPPLDASTSVRSVPQLRSRGHFSGTDNPFFRKLDPFSYRMKEPARQGVWDNSNWSPPTITVVSGGAVAQFEQGKFNPVTAASAMDIEETLAFDPLRVLLTALGATNLHSEMDTVLHGFPQDVAVFTWKGERLRILLSSFSQMPTCIEVMRARPMETVAALDFRALS